VAGLPPALPDPDSHAGRLLRDAVAVAAENAMRERDEALADRIGRATAFYVAAWLNGEDVG
jgi:hypothetical protein